MTVLKTRATRHDPDVREFNISRFHESYIRSDLGFGSSWGPEGSGVRVPASASRSACNWHAVLLRNWPLGSDVRRRDATFT